MTNATISKGKHLSGTNAELLSDVHLYMAQQYEHDYAKVLMAGLVDALESASLTSAEDQMYVKRMEAERDAAYLTIRALTQAAK